MILIGVSSANMTNYVNINSHGEINFLLPLHVEGQWIVDSNGNRVQLRGAACVYDAYDNRQNLETYVQWMKQAGCNCIRLSFIMPNPSGLWFSWGGDEYDVAEMNATLTLLQQNGIYAILDCHDNWGTLDRQGFEGILPNYNQAWINGWVAIAQTWKNNPAIAMYELFNEPYDTSGDNIQRMRQFYTDCTNAIRAVGDNHIIMCWAGDFDSASQILPNMCLNLHNWWAFGTYPWSTGGYNWFPEDANGAPNQYIAAEIYASETIAAILETRSALNCPVMLGEFGVYNYSMASPDVYNNKIEIMMAEQYGIPWQTWFMDGWINGQYGSDGPTFWTNFVNQKLGGAFTSNYVPSSLAWNQTYNMLTFPALPFNIWQCVNTSVTPISYLQNQYQVWGICQIGIGYATQVTEAAFYNPTNNTITIRAQEWSPPGGTYWGTLIGDYYVTLAPNQSTVISAPSGITIQFYPWR